MYEISIDVNMTILCILILCVAEKVLVQIVHTRTKEPVSTVVSFYSESVVFHQVCFDSFFFNFQIRC